MLTLSFQRWGNLNLENKSYGPRTHRTISNFLIPIQRFNFYKGWLSNFTNHDWAGMHHISGMFVLAIFLVTKIWLLLYIEILFNILNSTNWKLIFLFTLIVRKEENILKFIYAAKGNKIANTFHDWFYFKRFSYYKNLNNIGPKIKNLFCCCSEKTAVLWTLKRNTFQNFSTAQVIIKILV